MQLLPNVIGLYSPVPQSGKGEVARIINSHYPYAPHKFATTLKRMLTRFLYDAGVSVGTITRMLEGDLKEIPIAELGGKTPRWLMQSLGTEWGRNCLHPDIWVKVAEAQATSDPMRVIFDDLRFKNEYQYIERSAGLLIKIIRPDASRANGHVSEGALCGLRFDHTIINDGTLDDLKTKVLEIMKVYDGGMDQTSQCSDGVSESDGSVSSPELVYEFADSEGPTAA